MEFVTQGIFDRRHAHRRALAYAFTSNERFGLFVPGFIGINTLIYGAWLYTGSKSSYQPRYYGPRGRNNGRRRWYERLTQWLTPEFMQDNFLLGTRNLRAGRWWTLLTSSISHRSLSHLASNMMAFQAFADVAVRLCGPFNVAVVLCMGSAVAGALAQLHDWRYRRNDGITRDRGNVRVLTLHYALGASSITAGLSMAVTLLQPWTIVQAPLLPISVPLWVSSLCWFLYDWYELSAILDPDRPTGHAGHLGGMAFGAVFAGLRLVGLTYNGLGFMDSRGWQRELDTIDLQLDI